MQLKVVGRTTVGSRLATTSPAARMGERSVVPVLAEQRLRTAAERTRLRSCETVVTEKEEERKEHLDPVG